MNPMGVIEMYDVGRRELRFRAVCACNWVGPTEIGAWPAAGTLRTHYEEAHA